MTARGRALIWDALVLRVSRRRRGGAWALLIMREILAGILPCIMPPAFYDIVCILAAVVASMLPSMRVTVFAWRSLVVCT